MIICIYQAPPVQLQNLFFGARVHCLVLEPKYPKFGTIPRHWWVTNRPFQNCISHWYAINIIEVSVISIGTYQFIPLSRERQDALSNASTYILLLIY